MTNPDISRLICWFFMKLVPIFELQTGLYYFGQCGVSEDKTVSSNNGVEYTVNPSKKFLETR